MLTSQRLFGILRSFSDQKNKYKNVLKGDDNQFDTFWNKYTIFTQSSSPGDPGTEKSTVTSPSRHAAPALGGAPSSTSMNGLRFVSTERSDLDPDLN